MEMLSQKPGAHRTGVSGLVERSRLLTHTVLSPGGDTQTHFLAVLSFSLQVGSRVGIFFFFTFQWGGTAGFQLKPLQSDSVSVRSAECDESFCCEPFSGY